MGIQKCAHSGNNVKRLLALFVFALLPIASCDSSKNIEANSSEKSSYLYTGNLSEMQFTISEDSAYKCYIVHTKYYSPGWGNTGTSDTSTGNTCKIVSDPFLQILDTIKEDTTKHKIWGHLSVEWERPKNDSGWVKEVKVNGNPRATIIYTYFSGNGLYIYSEMEYYGETKSFKPPDYFDQVTYTVTLTKPDNLIK